MRFTPYWFLAGLAPALAAQTTPQAKTAKVTYLSGSSVYIAAGREEGVREDTQVDLIRGGAAVATLKVAYLSSHQASCTIVGSPVTIVVGDTVRFVPAAPEAPAAAPATVVTSGGGATAPPGGAASPTPRPSYQRRSVRGRIAAGYLLVNGRDSTSADLSQPALDLSLVGQNLGGGPIGLAVDVRTRYTTTSLAAAGLSTQAGLTRVYQAALSFNKLGSPLRVTLGRQYSPVLSAVSYFDGILTEYDRSSWGFGLLAGFQPDPADLQFSTQIREYGGYAQLHSRPTSRHNWSFTLGALGSYLQGNPNREFAYAQWTYTSRAVSAFLSQELDLYRGDKTALGEPPVSPTSTLANLIVRVSEVVTLNAGFDNRRNVRLYRDVITPVTVFDDAFREGVWGGASLFLARRFRVAADVRSTLSGPTAGTNAYTVYLSGDRLTPIHLNFRLRSSRYQSATVAGWLHSAALGITPVWWLQFELLGGTRNETESLSTLGLNDLTWYGANLDLSLGRAWYLSVAGTRENGTVDNNDQLFAGLTYRF